MCLVHWTDKIPTTYPIVYADIPDEYRPDARAYCPPLVAIPAFDYEVKFDGGSAVNHQASPAILGKFHAKFEKFLKQPFDLKALKNAYEKAVVFVKAITPNDAVYAPSSLKINYHIELEKPAQAELFDKPEDSLIFIDAYLTYCLNHLADDLPLLQAKDFARVPHFNDLWVKYEALVGQYAQANPEAAITEFTADLLKIAILGTDHLTQTQYTESLHLDKYIDVLAVGKIVDGNVKHLEIQYEPIEQ